LFAVLRKDTALNCHKTIVRKRPAFSLPDYPHHNPGRGRPSTLQGHQPIAYITIPVEAGRRPYKVPNGLPGM